MDDDFENLSHHDQQMRLLQTIIKELGVIRLWLSIGLILLASILGKLLFWNG